MGEVIGRTKNGRFLGYYLRFYEGGRRRIIASKQTSHSEARRMLLAIEARIARGERGVTEKAPLLTVRELAERFLREYSRPSLKDLESYRSRTYHGIKRLLDRLGERRIDQITSADISRARDALQKELKPATVRTSINRFSVLFSWARKQGLVPANPCVEVERPRSEAALDFLSREEVETLLSGARARRDSLPDQMRFVGIALAVHTGLRKGELLGLRWIDLDLDTQRLTVARSFGTAPKSGKARHLRIPSALLPVLREWRSLCPQTPSGVVLPAGRSDSRAPKRCVMLGLPGLLRELGLRAVERPWHLLRHTFASHFVMQGGSILTLQKILGHSDLQMTLIYAHLAPDFLGQEMERVSFKLE
jgi:integrase